MTLGADMHLSCGRDDLSGVSDLGRISVAFGLGVLVNDVAPGCLAASVLGATILDQRFDARSFGARIEGGLDLAFGRIATGPVVGLTIPAMNSTASPRSG